ncbi:hypothetical protein [Stutzerimonas stutzeri]
MNKAFVGTALLALAAALAGCSGNHVTYGVSVQPSHLPKLYQVLRG